MQNKESNFEPLHERNAICNPKQQKVRINLKKLQIQCLYIEKYFSSIFNDVAPDFGVSNLELIFYIAPKLSQLPAAPQIALMLHW